MKGYKKKILYVFVIIIMAISIIPMPKTYAASYPSCFMYADSTFEQPSVTREIVCDSNTQLYFNWMPAYNNEKYKILIYNSNGDVMASAEGYPPDSPIGHITINWDTSDYEEGKYTIEVHKMFYSMLEWRESPTPSTFWVTLIRSSKLCEHSWDEGRVVTAPTCKSEGSKEYTCKNCGEKKNETIPKTTDHSWDEGRVVTAPTCKSEGSKEYTCKNCGKKKNEIIPKTTDEAVEVAKLKISKKKVTLKKGKSITIKIKEIATGDSIKSWKSSNKKIASVNKKGKIVAKKKGKATITLTTKYGEKAKCKVIVK